MKIIINGADGKMGHMLREMATSEHDEIVALVDTRYTIRPDNIFDQGRFKYINDVPERVNADCVIDFSNHQAALELVAFCENRKLPVLIASTGHTDSELEEIHNAAKKIPVFMSPNMSVGVALLADIAERVTKIFGSCDIEMIEAHHNQKLDVPSGTALMLAKRIQEARPESTFNIGRHEDGKRPANEIGIHSLRYGTEVGTHEIIFSNGLETITLRHDAKNRALFAKGALSAARWLIKQSAGFYDMKDFLKG